MNLTGMSHSSGAPLSGAAHLCQSIKDSVTTLLESDPLVKLLERAAYRKIQLAARINDAARSGLLDFAMGADLDH